VTSKPKSINHSPVKEDPSKKASIWIALGDSTYRRLWLAMVISGSCIAAQNTAIYWALNALGATTVVISLMATVSALPATLFTLPAGAIADMVDRKKILLAVQLWHAFIAVGLAILWLAHLLNPYIILTSGFLFSVLPICMRPKPRSSPRRVATVACCLVCVGW
jgi:MFS family permease